MPKRTYYRDSQGRITMFEDAKPMLRDRIYSGESSPATGSSYTFLGVYGVGYERHTLATDGEAIRHAMRYCKSNFTAVDIQGPSGMVARVGSSGIIVDYRKG